MKLFTLHLKLVKYIQQKSDVDTKKNTRNNFTKPL